MECDKMLAVRDKSQTIGEFLEWCSEQEIWLASYVDEGRIEPRMAPITDNTEKILARYFGIDLEKVEQEKRELLAKLRGEHEATPA